MTRSRKGLGAIALVAGLGLVAGACSSDKAATTTTAKAGETTTSAAVTTAAPKTTTTVAKPAGGTVTVALADLFGSGNSLTAEDSLFSNTIVMNGILPSPYLFNEKAEIFQDKNIIDSAEVTSKSPQVVTYKMNAKAAWSDGAPIDCSDFQLAWISENGLLNAQENGADKKDKDGNVVKLFAAATTTGYESIKSVECSDGGKTIVTTYADPFADWQGLFGLLLPAHAVAKKAAVADIAKAYAAKDVKGLAAVAEVWNNGYKTDKGFDKNLFVSGGPFSLSASEYEKSVTIVRNDKFWGPAAQADEVIFSIIKEDATAVQSLQNGDVQLIQPQPDPDLLKLLEGAKGIHSEVDGGYTFEHLDLNLAFPAFQDKAVRQAVQLCFPREEILAKLIKPVAKDAVVLNNSLYIPAQKDYADVSNGMKTDIAKAKTLLEGAGWKLNGDTYEKNGKKLEFKLLHKKNARRSNEQQLMAASCKLAGISVLDDGDDKWSSRAGNSQYDAVVFAWTGSPLLSSQKSLYYTKGGQNWNGLSSKEIDAQFDIISKDLDPAKVSAAGKKTAQLLWDEAVTLPIFQFPDLLAYTEKLKNAIYNPTTSGWTWNVQAWILEK